MSERSELRRRREERMENGPKNLKGARLFPETFSNHGFGDASRPNLYSLSDSFSFPFSGGAENVFQL